MVLVKLNSFLLSVENYYYIVYNIGYVKIKVFVAVRQMIHSGFNS